MTNQHNNSDSRPGQQDKTKIKSAKASHALLKLSVEMGPLLVFFLANSRPDILQPLLTPFFALLDYTPPAVFAEKPIFLATLIFMMCMVLALAVSLIVLRHIPVMPLVSGAMVLVFGGLTLWFADDHFIKIKPTVVNCLFGTALLAGVASGKFLLKIVLDSVLFLDEEGWRILSLRWGCFFYLLAILNEVVWRTQTDAVWINFKVFGIMPLTVVFAMAQTGLINRHQMGESGQSESY
jgi:intracellular septation protein